MNKNKENCLNFTYLFETELRKVIKERRKNLHLSQTHISVITGINQTTISFLESGKTNFTIEQIIKISSALNINFIELLDIARKKCQNKIKPHKLSPEEKLESILINYNILPEDINKIKELLKKD